MHVQASKPWRVQNGLGQDQPVGDHDRRIDRVGRHLFAAALACDAFVRDAFNELSSSKPSSRSAAAPLVLQPSVLCHGWRMFLLCSTKSRAVCLGSASRPSGFQPCEWQDAGYRKRRRSSNRCRNQCGAEKRERAIFCGLSNNRTHGIEAMPLRQEWKHRVANKCSPFDSTAPRSPACRFHGPGD